MAEYLKTSNSSIVAVSTVVPSNKVTNDHFSYLSDEKSLKKSFDMIGVKQRFWSDESITAADLCIKAAKDIFDQTNNTPDDIDAVLFVTQSPNYQMPATVFEIHKRLKIKESAICYEVNLGCSGYVNGIFLAKTLISMGLSKVLLLAGETPSKFLDMKDTGTSILFGDAGSASIIAKTDSDFDSTFRFNSRGEGYKTISIPSGIHKVIDVADQKDSLYMNGPDVFNFTIKEIPKFINEHVENISKKISDYDYVLLHQANLFMLNHIYKKIGVSDNQKLINIDKFGNTSSATIPLLLTDENFIKKNDSNVLVAGFGVGLSWALADVKIYSNTYLNHMEY